MPLVHEVMSLVVVLRDWCHEQGSIMCRYGRNILKALAGPGNIEEKNRSVAVRYQRGLLCLTELFV